MRKICPDPLCALPSKTTAEILNDEGCGHMVIKAVPTMADLYEQALALHDARDQYHDICAISTEMYHTRMMKESIYVAVLSMFKEKLRADEAAKSGFQKH
jgi:hypothetical protein